MAISSWTYQVIPPCFHIIPPVCHMHAINLHTKGQSDVTFETQEQGSWLYSLSLSLSKPLSSFICFDHFKHQENGKHGSRSFRPWWRKEKVPKTRTGKTYLRFKMSSYGVSGLPSKIKVSHPCFTWVYNLLFCWLLKSNHSFGH
jgi:hypothetical protein